MSARAEPPGFSAPRDDDDTTAARAGAAGVATDAPEVPTDALPVLVSETAVLGVRRVEAIEPKASQSLALPVVQAAAAAAGGFVAGAAVVGLVHRRARQAALGKRGRGARGVTRGARSQARGGELVQIVGSRSFLLDVHLLGER